MRIVISSGHGKYVQGASGYLNEVDEARRVVNHVADYLSVASGVECTAYHDDVSRSQNENLHRIVDFHNSRARDLDVSVHFNANGTTSKPLGTECLYLTQKELAAKVARFVAEGGGLTNRGAKKRTNLYFLNNTAAPAILIETCFVTSKADADLYGQNFDAICKAIAEAISGQEIGRPPGQPPQPERPENPRDVPLDQRPEIGRGDSGPDVEDCQQMLPAFPGVVDGDFGEITEGAVLDYQSTRGLLVDGRVGENTWKALYERKPPLPPPAPPPAAFNMRQQQDIMDIAVNSEVYDYEWDDRGVAPRGYMQGMALAFGQTYRKLKANHPAAVEMAKARTSSDKDALHIYRSKFDSLGMSNEHAGADTLRHLYALMLGHGMRESSGQFCEGRDQSASNVTSDTAEAGLFQTSYNAHGSSAPHFDNLMSEYSAAANKATCYRDAFDEEVECDSEDWENYGSGAGLQFQKLCKECPCFATETAALTLRNLANHYGPIVRKESELRAEADEMFKQVQAYVDSLEAVA